MIEHLYIQRDRRINHDGHECHFLGRNRGEQVTVTGVNHSEDTDRLVLFNAMLSMMASCLTQSKIDGNQHHDII